MVYCLTWLKFYHYNNFNIWLTFALTTFIHYCLTFALTKSFFCPLVFLVTHSFFLCLTFALTNLLIETMGENNLHQDIKRRVKPGYEITSIARHIFRKYLLKLFKLVLVTPSASSSVNNNSTPFANAVKEWTLQFVGELVSHLSTALNGGVGDASILINYYLQEVSKIFWG